MVAGAQVNHCSDKQCSKCGEVKSASLFYRDTKTPTGLSSRCKQCQKEASRKSWQKNREKNLDNLRERQLQSKYGISQKDYLSMMAAQHGRCAICGKHADSERDGKLRVDHCHSTGKVRGLLCDACNTGLGKFKDDKNALIAAVEYLSR